VNSTACRRSPLPLALFAASLILLCAPALTAQAKPVAGSAAQPFDAAGMRSPVEIGLAGVVQAGDDPAWAQPDFDDSTWLPVNAKTRLVQYFPNSQPPVVWRRLHVKIDPKDNQLALQAFFISRAFEVYVNGQPLIQSGQVDPYVPYLQSARLIAPIPDAQLHSGALVIAIRIRSPLTKWTSALPGFNASMLALGDQNTFRQQNQLSIIGQLAATTIEDLLALGVGLVALALFLGQRQRMEYFWIFILGVLNAASLPLLFLSFFRNIPVTWFFPNELIFYGTYASILLMVQAFLRKPFGWLFWLCSNISFVIATVCDVGYQYGVFPASYDAFFTIPIGIVFAAVVPVLLFRQMRRGDREAAILLIPFIFYSLSIYAQIGTGLLAFIPPLRLAAVQTGQTLSAFPLGIFTVGLGDLGALSFYFSLAIIMVLRSTRMSRQQGILESEVAAAREVQQVILPDHIESVPGFEVESVYHPAQEVGGDFFQIIPHKTDGSLLIVAGDVTGKGLQAGMLVALLVGAIRTSADTSADPESVLHVLNQRLLGRGHAQATCLALKIAHDGAVTLANAGHLPPYLNGEPVSMEGTLPLGMIDHAQFSLLHFQLKDGDKLLLMSDGIVEATDAHGHLFGFDRVRELLRTAKTAAEVASAAQSFGQEDDISVISVTRTALQVPVAA
jgi:hypothetical protein